MKWLLIFISFSLNAATVIMPEYTRDTVTLSPSKSGLKLKLYRQSQQEINPFVSYPYVKILDKCVDVKKQNIYDKTYSTEEFGLRRTPEAKQDLSTHLIIAGDSSIFGVGCEDNETLSYFLAKKFPEHSVYNFGLAGTGPHSHLRFLEIFTISDLAPKNYKKGVFILDFHHYLMQRLIGAKSFIPWGKMTPRYLINDQNKLEYLGPFSESFIAKFYSFLDKLPFSKILFPDLPQIGDRHLELAARIILEIKKKYLAQTAYDNKFFVLMNPEGKDERIDGPRDDERTIMLNALAQKLTAHNIDVLTFKENEIMDLPHYRSEGHFTPKAQKNYAEMIFKKIKDKI